MSPYPLIEPLEDETLFSLSSRLHRFWGHHSDSETSIQLFGRGRGGSHHDFPNCLAEFVTRTRGVYGNARSLASDYTMLRFYEPFLSEPEVGRTIEQMAGRSVAHLKLRLGILTSRFRANHVLKACHSCMRDDARATGWVYWHASHQWPGVWTCVKHGTPLWRSTVKSNGVERFHWHLPSITRLSPGWTGTDARKLAAMHDLSAFTNRLLESEVPAGTISLENATVAFRHALSEGDMISSSGRLRLSPTAASYLDHCSRIREAPDLTALPTDLKTAKVQLGRMLRAPRSGTHPLRILSVASWLFQSAQDFISALGARASTPHISESVSSDLTETSDMRKSILISRMTSGDSARAAAISVGVTVGTAMAWAAQAGLQAATRPKTLKAAQRAELRELLKAGTPKISAAETMGVTVQAVTRQLQTEVGLRAAWQAARFDQARTIARNEWTAALGSGPPCGTAAARVTAPRAFAWLYRNDREWLREHQPERLQRPARASSVQWQIRDHALCILVERAANGLRPVDKSGRIKLWQIIQAVPELKPHLRSMDRLPLTAAAITLIRGLPAP